MSEALTLLISSAGRRVELMDSFRSAARELKIDLRVLAADCRPHLSAACHHADLAFPVPLCSSPRFVDAMLEICAAERVRLLVPTIDPELDSLATGRGRFQDGGTVVAISAPPVIAMARNKLQTHHLLVKLGISTPRTETVEGLLSGPKDWNFPLVLKPVDGSSSVGLHFAPNLESVKLANIVRSNCVAQEYLEGKEYTVNLFFDEQGLRCAISHLRLETRGGEVSKAVTERLPSLMKIADTLGGYFAGQARGALCFQAIVSRTGEAAVIDLNARFGGGYPLAHRAGAKFTNWMLESVLGRPSTATPHWEEGVAMLRYDSSVFTGPAELQSRFLTPAGATIN